ncbi:hypothetical protein OC834_004682 [Tilletia horrida]|nr:hypothetical protein OC834_004682 [Tilletia horrida]
MLKTLSSVFRVGRARYFAGYDLAGNAFYEYPSRSGSTDPRHTRRVIDWKEKREPSEYDQSSIPAQWVAWLRHTRRQAPTLEELQVDAERIMRVRENARLIAERDAAWRASLLQAPAAGEDDAAAPAAAQRAHDDARLTSTSGAGAHPASSAQVGGADGAQPHSGRAPETAASASSSSSSAPRRSARTRAAAAVPTSEVRSELVDSDRVQRSYDLSARTSAPAAAAAAAATARRARAAVPLTQQDPADGAASSSARDDAEALSEEDARRPDQGVWEASRQRLREQQQMQR